MAQHKLHPSRQDKGNLHFPGKELTCEELGKPEEAVYTEPTYISWYTYHSESTICKQAFLSQAAQHSPFNSR